jgi:molybdopterin converting factor small subunit
MQIRVIAHGLLTAAAENPEGAMALSVPQSSTIQKVLAILHERSPLFDPRAMPIAVIESHQVPLNHTLQDGDEVHLYPIFGGG